MNLEFTEEEAATLLRELDAIIAADRYFLSPRITTPKAIRKIRPEPEREPLPPLKRYVPPRAGVRVRMITGDQKDTATAIARELGLASNTLVANIQIVMRARLPAPIAIPRRPFA
jgi:hypothetical protein